MIHLNIYKGSPSSRHCKSVPPVQFYLSYVYYSILSIPKSHLSPFMDLAIDHKAQAYIKLYINILPFCLASDVRHILCTDSPFSRNCLFLFFNQKTKLYPPLR